MEVFIVLITVTIRIKVHILMHFVLLLMYTGDVVLDWSPLFSVVKVIPDNSEYLVSSTVTVTICLLYHGQKVHIYLFSYTSQSCC